jgi:hypothetical protein
MAAKQPEKLYNKLIALYPREFRERFGESMEQTFADLCSEWAKSTPITFSFLLRVFLDTAAGIASAHLEQIIQKGVVNSAVTRPRIAAFISLLLCIPFAVSIIPFLDIELLAGPVRAALTFDGQQLSMFGRIVVFSGVMLLPVAMLLNLVPMFRVAGEGRKVIFAPRAVNLITGLAVLLPLLMIARWIVFEAISCSRGICD